MADKFSPEKRALIMSKVRGKNTGPEKTVRSLLHSMGYRFRLHAKDIPGKPDIVFRTKQKVIFVNGCFWHGHKGCKRSALPVTNAEFWAEKIEKNTKRDLEVRQSLRKKGWKYLDLWQCQILDRDKLADMLSLFLENME